MALIFFPNVFVLVILGIPVLPTLNGGSFFDSTFTFPGFKLHLSRPNFGLTDLLSRTRSTDFDKIYIAVCFTTGVPPCDSSVFVL